MSVITTASDRPEWPKPARGLPRRVVLVGPPGAGKSSQGTQLASWFRVAHFSTGELLREEVRRGSPLGRQAGVYMGAGRLVPDWLILDLVQHHFGHALEDGFVLDGYPRSVDQAQRFMRSLGRARLDRVIELAIPDEVAVRRLTARVVCGRCGHTDAESSSVPCSRCGSAMTRRDDDHERVVRSRLGIYRAQTEPMLAFFRDAGLLSTIDGNRPPDLVTTDLVQVLTDNADRANFGYGHIAGKDAVEREHTHL